MLNRYQEALLQSMVANLSGLCNCFTVNVYKLIDEYIDEQDQDEYIEHPLELAELIEHECNLTMEESNDLALSFMMIDSEAKARAKAMVKQALSSRQSRAT